MKNQMQILKRVQDLSDKTISCKYRMINGREKKFLDALIDLVGM